MREFIIGFLIGILISISIIYYTTPKETNESEIIESVLLLVDDLEDMQESELKYEYGELCHTYVQYNGSQYERKRDCYTIEEILELSEYYLGGN